MKPVAKPPEPAPSWWVGLSRDEFSAIVKQKQAALQQSEEGRKPAKVWHTA